MATLDQFVALPPVHEAYEGVSFRAGQPIWWTPPAGRRPSFMTRTQTIIAGVIRSVNLNHRTAVIEYQDPARRILTFLVPLSELSHREIPR